MKCTKGHVWEDCTCADDNGLSRTFAAIGIAVATGALVSLILNWTGVIN